VANVFIKPIGKASRINNDLQVIQHMNDDMSVCIHGPLGVQSVPCRVIDTERSERSEVQLVIPPCSLMF
jgi:ferredoxin-thioredoxin reductase catalytic subunit